jgi:hypothetical protein
MLNLNPCTAEAFRSFEFTDNSDSAFFDRLIGEDASVHLCAGKREEEPALSDFAGIVGDSSYFGFRDSGWRRCG